LSHIFVYLSCGFLIILCLVVMLIAVRMAISKASLVVKRAQQNLCTDGKVRWWLISKTDWFCCWCRRERMDRGKNYITTCAENNQQNEWRLVDCRTDLIVWDIVTVSYLAFVVIRFYHCCSIVLIECICVHKICL